MSVIWGEYSHKLSRWLFISRLSSAILMNTNIFLFWINKKTIVRYVFYQQL